MYYVVLYCHCYCYQQLADSQKYRIGGRAIPNNDKEQSKLRLAAKLADAQAARRQTVSSNNDESNNSNQSKSSSSRSNKTVKKPPPNFGGGILGTK